MTNFPDTDIPPEDNVREAVILLADMVNYGHNVGSLPLEKIRSSMLAYHTQMREIINSRCNGNLSFEPTEGDGTAVVYNCQNPNQREHACTEMVNTAIAVSRAITSGSLPATRVGLSTGQMVEAIFDNNVLRFSPSFTSARRLETLCSWFSTSFLMDKEVAGLQESSSDTVVSIGKITPKHFDHPIHIYSIYEPGINNVPEDVDGKLLRDFIRCKNIGTEYFCGNERVKLFPDFNEARLHLTRAEKLFTRLSGCSDIATRRLLDYIEENPLPGPSFMANGMRISESPCTTADYELPSLADTLLKSLNKKLYRDLQAIRHREKFFEVIWHKKGEVIVRYNKEPDGIYFIVTGQAKVINADNTQISTLKTGDIFGEMAYFSANGKRTATVIAESDMVLRRMNSKELDNHPESRDIFATIASQRQMQAVGRKP